MEKRFRDQLLAESGEKEEEIKSVNLEIEEREISKNGIFVLIRNKENKWVITMCGSLISGKEFDTKEEAEEHIAKKRVGRHPNRSTRVHHAGKRRNEKH